MLEFLSKNWGSITVLILVIGAAVFAIMKMYSNKKQGKTSCGCGSIREHMSQRKAERLRCEKVKFIRYEHMFLYLKQTTQ